jgi:hypothetical protein
MLESRDDLMSIVVLEAGAAWPVWLTDYQRLAPNAVVIAQADTESVHAFRARVVHRVADAKAAGTGRIRVGVLVASGRSDEGVRGLREGVARSILNAMGTRFEAELVLAGGGSEGDPSRQELFALAGALCEELGGTSVNVRVRFCNSRSGVMRSVASSADSDAHSQHGRRSDKLG